MTSFGYRLNPRYAIKECLSCGALYTGDFCCSKGNVEDKILVPKLSKNCAKCAKCGHPVNGPYCQRCTLLREKLEEDLVTYFQYFQNTSESSDDSSNVVNAPREPFVVKKDHGVNPPHIDECCLRVWTPATVKNQRTRTCYECGSLRHYKSECPIVKFNKRMDMIHGRVMASKPKTIQDAIEIVTKLMNKKISTLAECQTENKKRLDNTSKNNQNQQQPNKRQNTGRAYTARHVEKKHYDGSKPLCFKCYYHRDGPCAPKCHQCNRFGHLARDC
nr:hypothetical protein [Tanacetum cinerariifolium]